MASISGQAMRPVACRGARLQSTPQAFRTQTSGLRQLPSKRLQRGSKSSIFRAAASQGVSTGPVNDGSFKELVLESDVPVLVDFWAPWCGPCRMIAPIVDELAVEFDGKLKAFKLNTDESPGVAAEYGIRSIPTVMFFKDGTKMDTVIGAVPKSTLVQTIEKYID